MNVITLFCVVQVNHLRFYANNKRDTNKGYIKYIFFVEGHYIPFDKQKWAGVSHQTFRIRTGNEIITIQPEPPVAIINATTSTGEVPLKAVLDASSSLILMVILLVMNS